MNVLRLLVCIVGAATLLWSSPATLAQMIPVSQARSVFARAGCGNCEPPNSSEDVSASDFGPFVADAEASSFDHASVESGQARASQNTTISATRASGRVFASVSARPPVTVQGSATFNFTFDLASPAAFNFTLVADPQSNCSTPLQYSVFGPFGAVFSGTMLCPGAPYNSSGVLAPGRYTLRVAASMGGTNYFPVVISACDFAFDVEPAIAIPVSQQRYVDAAAACAACPPRTPQHFEATQFGLFNRSATVTAQSSEGAANGQSQQNTTLHPAGANGFVRASSMTTHPDADSLGASFCSYTFSIVRWVSFDLSASWDAAGSPHDPATLRLDSAAGPLVDLTFTGASPPAMRSGVLAPGTYTITAQANAESRATPGTIVSGIAFSFDLQPECPCNLDASPFLDSADFFAFLTGFFSNDADFNLDGVTDSADFFDYLSCFFVGCA